MVNLPPPTGGFQRGDPYDLEILLKVDSEGLSEVIDEMGGLGKASDRTAKRIRFLDIGIEDLNERIRGFNTGLEKIRLQLRPLQQQMRVLLLQRELAENIVGGGVRGAIERDRLTKTLGEQIDLKQQDIRLLEEQAREYMEQRAIVRDRLNMERRERRFATDLQKDLTERGRIERKNASDASKSLNDQNKLLRSRERFSRQELREREALEAANAAAIAEADRIRDETRREGLRARDEALRRQNRIAREGLADERESLRVAREHNDILLTRSVILAGIAAGVVFVGFKLVQQFARLEQIQSAVRANLVGTQADVEGLFETAERIATDFPISVEQSFIGLQRLVQQGIRDVETVNAVLRTGSRAATVAGIEQEEAVNGLVAAWRIYGETLSGDVIRDTEMLGDVFQATARSSRATLEEMIRQFPNVAATARNYGISLQEVAALMGTVRNQGVEMSRVTRGLNILLRNGADPTRNLGKRYFELTGRIFSADVQSQGLQATLVRVRNEVGTVERFLALFGRENAALVAQMLTSTQGMRDFERILMETTNSAGLLTAAFKQFQDDIGFQFEQLLDEIKIHLLDIGRAIAQGVAPAVFGLGKIVLGVAAVLAWISNIPVIGAGLWRTLAIAVTFFGIAMAFAAAKALLAMPIFAGLSLTFGKFVIIATAVASVLLIIVDLLRALGVIAPTNLFTGGVGFNEGDLAPTQRRQGSSPLRTYERTPGGARARPESVTVNTTVNAGDMGDPAELAYRVSDENVRSLEQYGVI